MANLYETYRPTTWTGVVGQNKAVRMLTGIRERSGFGGKAFFISGQSGTGKTTIGRLIAADVAAEFSTIELDASEVTPADVREWEHQFRGRPLGANGWAVLLNEAHGLRKDTIRALLVALERIPSFVVFVFTTTSEAKESLFEDQLDAHPLLSRCVEIALARRDLAKPFAERARTIAQASGLDGRPIEDYVRLLQDCKNNLRQALQRIEAGAMLSNVESAVQQ
jgi:replication-associated recombination protein RarA